MEIVLDSYEVSRDKWDMTVHGKPHGGLQGERGYWSYTVTASKQFSVRTKNYSTVQRFETFRFTVYVDMTPEDGPFVPTTEELTEDRALKRWAADGRNQMWKRLNAKAPDSGDVERLLRELSAAQVFEPKQIFGQHFTKDDVESVRSRLR